MYEGLVRFEQKDSNTKVSEIYETTQLRFSKKLKSQFGECLLGNIRSIIMVYYVQEVGVKEERIQRKHLSLFLSHIV